MKTEKAFKVQIHNFPTGLINSIKNKEGWEVRCLTENHEINQDYGVFYNGKQVIRFGRLHGFGFGSNAVYPFLRLSVIKLLRSVIEVNVWDTKASECVYYENEYVE